jgi:hypothetical protein
LPDEVFEQLRIATERDMPASYPPSLALRVAAQLPDNQKEISEVLLSVLTAESLRQTENLDAETAARELSQADGLTLSKPKRARLSERLARLLSIETIRLSVRSAALAAADERQLIAAQAVVNMRPVFLIEDARSQGAPKPTGALVVYSLRLAFHQYNRDDSIVLVLDRDDVRTLRDELTRVEAEGDAARDVLLSAGMRQFLDEGQPE